MRWRLAAVIAIPTVTAAVLAGLQINSAASSFQAFGRVQHLVRLNADVVRLTQMLEDERDLSAGFIAGGRRGDGSQFQLQGVRQQVTQQISVVNADAGGIATSAGYPAATVLDLQHLLDALNGDLPLLRTAVDNTKLPADAAITAYTNQIINTADTFSAAVGNGANDAELQSNVITLAALQSMENQMSLQRGILLAALSANPAVFAPNDLSALQGAEADENAELQAFDQSTTITEQQHWKDTVTGTGVDRASEEEALAIALGQQAPGRPLTANSSLTPQQWWQDMSVKLSDNRTVANGPGGLVSMLTSRAGQLRSHWASVLLWTVIVTLLLLVLVLLVSTMVARSLTRPLRKLRSDALDVAGHRLPDTVRRLSQSEGAEESLEIEPIGVNSTDEIGEVARAFDQVHREAVRLAADEAMLRGNLNAMFINLSRRSQSLIERQLSLIDSLEQSEQDPGRLASLFRLDHLATRMRRNSENLLVLAGHEVARRWSQPVPLVDVLRAAISEIEQYERVVLNVQPGIVVVGQAVNDVVHLVAELVENATTFSPEDTQVYVSGQPLSSGGVLLDITDNGVGISDQEMAHANWRLDNPPVVDVAVSRRMGLFVVGRLAARHGVRVRLRHAQAGGLTALVWLPESVAAPEVAPPLGRLRRFEADDFGPQPSLSAPPASTSATVQATAAARIPRFSSPGPNTSPSFTPAEPQPPLGPVAPRASGGAGTPSRMPSFGGGQPPARSADQDANGWDLPSRDSGSRDAGTRDWAAVRDWDSGRDWEGAAAAAEPAAADPEATSVMDAATDSRSESGWSGNGRSWSGDGQAAGNGNGSRSGEVTIPPAAVQDQRLPIFDSVESDWFRRSGKSLTANRMAQSATGPQPVQPGTAVQATAQPAATWTSPADEGWRKAQLLATPAAGETTQAGLPKRVPRANLVPGSVGGGAEQEGTEQSAPSRSAEDIRSRMSSFQRGVREGRAAAPQIEEQ